MILIIRIFWLFVGHALCDFGLQSKFMADGKSPFDGIAGVPWFWCMFPHCLLHAGAVFLVTQNFYLALAEFVVHFALDVLKSRDTTTFGQDQLFHYTCKVLWAVLA